MAITNSEKVKEFMLVMGQKVRDIPTYIPEEEMSLRFALNDEEHNELQEAIEEENLVKIVDALTDILYVTYGFGHALGVDLDACLEEAHSSNMSKLGPDGKPIYREDGKVLKGPNYRAPNFEKVLKIK